MRLLLLSLSAATSLLGNYGDHAVAINTVSSTYSEANPPDTGNGVISVSSGKRLLRASNEGIRRWAAILKLLDRVEYHPDLAAKVARTEGLSQLNAFKQLHDEGVGPDALKEWLRIEQLQKEAAEAHVDFTKDVRYIFYSEFYDAFTRHELKA